MLTANASRGGASAAALGGLVPPAAAQEAPVMPPAGRCEPGDAARTRLSARCTLHAR